MLNLFRKKKETKENKKILKNVVNQGHYDVIVYVKIIDKNLLLYEDDSSKRKEQAFKFETKVTYDCGYTFHGLCNELATSMYASIQVHFPDGENAFEKFESMFPYYEDGEIYGKD